MKKIFYGVLALAAVVACSRDLNVKQEASSPITFDNSFVEIKTRAAVDPSITTQNINAFDVWAYMDNKAAVVLEAERVTKGDNGWSYEHLQYWTPNHSYYFGAIAPVDNPNIVVDTNSADEYGLGKVTFTNTDGTVDLIYASKKVVTGSDVLYNDPGKVHLQFAHQLAKIKFTFKNAFLNENNKVVIKDIKMVAPLKGEVKLSTGVWMAETNGTVELDFGDVEAGQQIEINKSGESDYERLTIPCDENRSYVITFTVELYHGTYATPAYTATKEVTLSDQAFQIGKNYNLKATINAENLELLPIEFDVIEVDEWVEDTAKDIF